MSQFRIGDRVQIKEEVCTVRYAGMIDEWPSQLAYGVEWDNASRGKHSGSTSSKQYFMTRIQKAGSFIKAPKFEQLAEKGRDLYVALKEKYATTSEVQEDIYFGSKKAEKYGFENLDRRNKNLKSLKHLSLDHFLVNDVPPTVENVREILEDCYNVQELDLSYNLFADISAACDILRLFKNVHSVNLSGNRFNRGWERLSQYMFLNVTTLNLSSCLMTIAEVVKVINCFPRLEMLHLSSNQFTSVAEVLATLPASLAILDLSHNYIEDIPQLSNLSNIQELDLSFNKIRNLPDTQFSRLRYLNVSHNSIESWVQVDKLHVLLPNMTSLQINGNPVVKLKDDNNSHYQIIARVGHLNKLNGSTFTEDARKDAELLFISKVISHQISFDPMLPRWKELTSAHNKSMSAVTVQEFVQRKHYITINCTIEGASQTSYEIKILPTYTVRHVKGLIARRISIEVDKFKVFYPVLPSKLEEIERQFCFICDYNIQDGDTLYVKEGKCTL